MKILDNILEQASLYMDAKQPTLAIKELKKAIKLIKRLRRKSK